MANKLYKLHKYSKTVIDIICCQTDVTDKRISVNVSYKDYFTSTEVVGCQGEHGNLPIPNGIKCPKCKEPIPEHILTQLRLLTS